MPTLHPLLVILGPTAAGKSALALDAAERFGGEIVNFDSLQLYRGFDIGTAKTRQSERRGIAHHLIDVVSPRDLFTAADYMRLGREALAEIRSRARLPVAVGGTGFYLRALVEGLFKGPARDEELRARLEGVHQSKGPGHLHRVLERLDPLSARRIHANDTPKLIRAIEVCLVGRAPMSSLLRRGVEPLQGFRIVRVGLDPPREALHQRIDRRARRMFDEGLLEEARSLLERGVPRSARAFGSLGYRQAVACLDGEITLEEAIESTARQTRKYAKRQMSWFRREPDVGWRRGFGDDPRVSKEVLEELERSIPE